MSIFVPPLGRHGADINPGNQLFVEPGKDQFPFHPFGPGGTPRNTWPHPRATVRNLEGWVRENRAALDKATAGFPPQDAELYRRLSYVSAKDDDERVRSAARELRGLLADVIKKVKAQPDVPYVVELEQLKMRLDGVRRDAHRYTGTYFQPSPRQ